MRNRYLDLLRALAIVRVIVYHFFGWPWLSIVLPAMGVMFALAGSLTAASLEKRPARQVVTSRLRRLLPPLWLLGLIAVPLMIWAGWAHESGGQIPFGIPRLLFWIFPLGDPPGSDKGVDAWEPLWYIRAYVWFILLSPLMYLMYRKIGWFAVAVPIALIVVIDKTGLTLPDTADAAMWDFVTFAGCWMAGFAHHDGRLARARTGLLVFVSLALGLAGIYWLTGHQGDDRWDLNDVSESQALWSLAFVLLALRWQPSMAWLARVRPLDRLVDLLNARAVTIYLWHNIAIAAVWPVIGWLALDEIGHHLDQPFDFAMAFVLTGVAVLLFGWVEDLAARRGPRWWPAGGSSPVVVPEPSLALVGAEPTASLPTIGEKPALAADGAGEAEGYAYEDGSYSYESGTALDLDGGPYAGSLSDAPTAHTRHTPLPRQAPDLPVAGRPYDPEPLQSRLVNEVHELPADAPDWFVHRRGASPN